jgi:hypothetical protein
VYISRDKKRHNKNAGTCSRVCLLRSVMRPAVMRGTRLRKRTVVLTHRVKLKIIRVFNTVATSIPGNDVHFNPYGYVCAVGGILLS